MLQQNQVKTKNMSSDKASVSTKDEKKTHVYVLKNMGHTIVVKKTTSLAILKVRKDCFLSFSQLCMLTFENYTIKTK